MENQTDLDVLKKLEEIAKDIDAIQKEKSQKILSRYPITFSLLSIFGLAAIVHGAENLFDSVPFLEKHPLLVLAVGVIILIITGTTYKLLQHKAE